jgi:O-antigen/teichoic acid export membrane protein
MRQRPFRPRLPGGIWRYYVGFSIGRMAGLVVLPIASRNLGVVGFGRFEAAFALFIAATIVLDAGQGAGIVRFVGDPGHSTADVLHAAARIQLVASMLAIACLAPPLLLFAAPDNRRGILLVALVLFAFIEGFAVIGGGVLRATDQDGLFALFSAARLVLTASLGAAGALLLGGSGALLGVAFGGTAFAAFALRELHRSKTQPSVRREVRTMARYGIPLIATTAAYWTLALSDRLFLRAFASDRALGAYAANYRLGGVLLLFFAGPLGLTWIPAARRAQARNAVDALRRQWSERYALACAAGTLALLVIGEWAIPSIFGTRFTFDRIVVAASAASAWFAGFYLFLGTPILLGKETRRLAAVSVLVVLVDVGANALLIPSFGAHGAAAATVIAYSSLCLGAVLVCPAPRLRWAFETRHLGVLAVSIVAAAVGVAAGTAAIVALLALLALAASFGVRAVNESLRYRTVSHPVENDPSG